MHINDKVLEFIQRRFKKDCNWLDGNCYYFAVILKDRFPEGRIYYEVIDGHFIFEYWDKFYDWTGIVSEPKAPIPWDTFNDYDLSWTKRIVRDCIM